MIAASQKLAREIVKIHESDALPDDATLDRLLGIQIEQGEASLYLPELLVQYGAKHRVYQGDNSYYYVRRLFKALAPFQPRSILDLGSGYGRVLFYGAMIWPQVKFHGIEMIPERVMAAQQLNQRLGLSINCEVGDAAQSPLPIVDCICNLNSFFPEIHSKVLQHLKKHAAQHPFLLVTVSSGNSLVEQEDWLEEVFTDAPPRDELDFRFFRPRQGNKNRERDSA